MTAAATRFLPNQKYCGPMGFLRREKPPFIKFWRKKVMAKPRADKLTLLAVVKSVGSCDKTNKELLVKNEPWLLIINLDVSVSVVPGGARQAGEMIFSGAKLKFRPSKNHTE